MAAFEYVALNPKGREKKGVLEADTPRQIRQQLREKGFTPLEVSHIGDTTKSSSKSGFSGSSMKVADLALITRQLATLVKASLPIEEALKAVAEQTERPKVKSIILGVRSKVMEGHTLADGMAEFPKIFNELYRSMVAAGERAGHLDTVLNRLADYTERRHKIRGKITAALVYPIVLITVAVSVVVLLMIFAVPKILAQFTNSGQELPIATKILIGMSDFLSSYAGLFTAVGILGAIVLFSLWLRKTENKRRWHGTLLKLPVLGRLSKNLNTSQFSSTLSILHSSGVPLLEAMKIGGKVLTNLKMREAVHEASIKVREGASLKKSLEQTRLFPPMMIHMIGSGEASGELEDMLQQVSDNQESQFENSVDIALNIMGPMIILFLGGMVFFIVLAMMLPIFELTSSIG
ncbi:type II secretion system inner membrane protein GspF [Kangiella sp. HZ709]|uniref:type II secretion system inner membrane protein GspF n=1 Tax=Kangiella sp. HZ709 TaxID=2666328 RepID=UPI0012B1547F|nr:type II secretion system inner membrane protein GspF [Kangiella sp. HZ709]MRX28218.1 type II secretion system protein GspF [Kangiella sp. HZ709]